MSSRQPETDSKLKSASESSEQSCWDCPDAEIVHTTTGDKYAFCPPSKWKETGCAAKLLAAVKLPIAARAGTRILIADSLVIARREIAAFLKEYGFEICGEAGDGRQAVEQALGSKPDIVLMDVTMPRMGGFDAARDILQASPMTQIIIMTTRTQPELATEAKKIGARGYISKGHAAAVLVEAIDLVLQGQTYFEPASQLQPY